MARELLTGNEALAEAAVRAGCNIFAGYPITPQTEILEYLSSRMPEAGRQFVQTESEIAAISVVFGAACCGARALTSTSGPGFSLKQEGISYIAACELPAVIIDEARYGSGLGDVWPAQGDYWQVTRNGGHGDYKVMAYTPGSVQEMVDIMNVAFDKAFEYRNPVIILCDGILGEMAEAVDLPEMREHKVGTQDWAMTGNTTNDNKIMMNPWFYGHPWREMGVPEGTPDYEAFLRRKYERMEANEQRWESVEVDDAEVILVSYGISSRICKDAVQMARAQGIKLGLIRPIVVAPFPNKAFENLPSTVKAFVDVEMSAFCQMQDDIRLACKCKVPVEAYYSGINVPDPHHIVEMAKEIIERG